MDKIIRNAYIDNELLDIDEADSLVIFTAGYKACSKLHDAEINKLKEALEEIKQKYIHGCMPADAMYQIANEAVRAHDEGKGL